MTLAERKKLLKLALAHGDVNDVDAYRKAIAGATQVERTALAKLVSARSMLDTEGGTPRLQYLLGALTPPSRLEEMFDRYSEDSWKRTDAVADFSLIIVEALCDRGPDFGNSWLAMTPPYAWWVPYAIAVAQHHQLSLAHSELLDCLFHRAGLNLPYPNWVANVAPEMVEQAVFTAVDIDMGAWRTGASDVAWLEKFVAGVCTVEGNRDRLLRAAVRSLLRDFRASSVTWLVRVIRLLEPTTDEALALRPELLAILDAVPAPSVLVAQELLSTVVEHLEVDATLEVSRRVVVRSEKNVVEGQLSLLGALAQRDPTIAHRVSQLLSPLMGELSPLLARKAARLVLTSEPAAVVEPASAVAVTVPGPRTRPRVVTTEPVTIADDDWRDWTLAALTRDADGRLLVDMVEHLLAHPKLATDQLVLPVCLDVLGSLTSTNDTEFLNQSHLHTWLAALIYGLATGKFVPLTDHGVYVAHDFAPDSVPDGWVAGRLWESPHVHAGMVSAHTFAISHRPRHLLAGWLKQVMAAVCRGDEAPRLRPARVAGLPTDTLTEISWTRQVVAVGRDVFGVRELAADDTLPLWTVGGAERVDMDAPLESRARDFSALPIMVRHEVRDAREYSSSTVVQWLGWWLRDCPDLFAAHLHPMLWWAGLNRGATCLPAAMQMLSATTTPLGPPSWSALALGLSAKDPAHRMHAAEAVASLAESGFLEPEALAAHLSQLADEGFVMRSRVASTLADASRISPIAGYRVLQTLSAWSPRLVGVTHAGALLEVLAQLAADYATAIDLPAGLAAKRRGSSGVALAIRAIEAVVSGESELALKAAAQAEAALVD